MIAFLFWVGLILFFVAIGEIFGATVVLAILGLFFMIIAVLAAIAESGNK